MNLKKIIEKFIKGSTVLETTDSSFNGKIKVEENLFGHKDLVVGGLAQSGPAVESIWQKVMRDNRYWELGISNCLILGLGAGNAAKIVNKYFPGAKITGVEIDPEIIKLGKKYFGLKEIKNLDIIISDAISFVVNHSLLTIGYDLVLVDLYLGDIFPKKAEEVNFLTSIGNILSPKGIAIFNRLYFGGHKEKTDKFEQIINKVLKHVEAKIIDYNKIFLCRK